MAFEIPIDKIKETFEPIVQHIPTVCELKGQDLFLYILAPILLGLILILLMLLRENIRIKWFKFFGSKGYIRVQMKLENERLISKIVKLDKFNNFKFPTAKDRLYSLEKMYNFVFGYDRYGFPVFLYDVNFILPLKINNQNLTEEIKAQLNITDAETISAVSMKLDSSIYHTVYDKKLISDLYSISGSNEWKKQLVWVLLGVGALVVLYYTGLLGKLLEMVGVSGVTPDTATQAVVKK
jgi:hypothetical protein